ncbi:hypothetical protein JG687_00019123, partial [Phytophthora cactorum]
PWSVTVCLREHEWIQDESGVPSQCGRFANFRDPVAPNLNLVTREVKGEIEVARSEDLPTIRPDPPSMCRLPDLDPTPDEDLGHIAAEDIGEGMAVVPDVPLTTEEVKIEDIQLDPTSNTPKEVDRLL